MQPKGRREGARIRPGASHARPGQGTLPRTALVLAFVQPGAPALSPAPVSSWVGARPPPPGPQPTAQQGAGLHVTRTGHK